MAIFVDIEDRIYDYTDAEVAAKAIEEFQYDHGINDERIIEIWKSKKGGLFDKLENCILNAVDANGFFKRAQENIPCGINLATSEEELYG